MVGTSWSVLRLYDLVPFSRLRADVSYKRFFAWVLGYTTVRSPFKTATLCNALRHHSPKSPRQAPHLMYMDAKHSTRSARVLPLHRMYASRQTAAFISVMVIS